MSYPPIMPVETMNARIQRSPFNRWLGLEVVAATAAGVHVQATWRDEMIGSPDAGSVAGGVLASIIDSTASYAVAAATGHMAVTLDMRIDFLRAARPGVIYAEGAVVKAGRSIATVDVILKDSDGQVVSSGRAVFFRSGGNA